MNEKKLLIMEIFGVAAIYLVAAFLHFFYDLSGHTVLSSFIGAVNESVWEHLKIFAIGYSLWAGLEYLALKPPLKTFVVAKAAGVFSLLISITLFFYLYTSVLKTSYVVVDLISSFVFTALSQAVSYLILTRWEGAGEYFYLAVSLWALLFSALLCFSYYPPKIPIFKDPVTSLYGVIPENIDEGAIVLSGNYKDVSRVHRR